MFFKHPEAQVVGYVIRMEDILIELEQRFVLRQALVLVQYFVWAHACQLGEKFADQLFYAHFIVLFAAEGLCGRAAELRGLQRNSREEFNTRRHHQFFNRRQRVLIS